MRWNSIIGQGACGITYSAQLKNTFLHAARHEYQNSQSALVINGVSNDEDKDYLVNRIDVALSRSASIQLKAEQCAIRIWARHGGAEILHGAERLNFFDAATSGTSRPAALLVLERVCEGRPESIARER
jgi:hypothetical protein